MVYYILLSCLHQIFNSNSQCAAQHVTAGSQNNLGNQTLLLLVWYAVGVNTDSDWLLPQFLKLSLADDDHVYILDQSETVGYNYSIISDYCNVVILM